MIMAQCSHRKDIVILSLLALSSSTSQTLSTKFPDELLDFSFFEVGL